MRPGPGRAGARGAGSRLVTLVALAAVTGAAGLAGGLPATRAAAARARFVRHRRHASPPACGIPEARFGRVSPGNPFASPILQAYLATRAGDITAAAYDADSGATYVYRPGVREQTASIVKVDILATLLHERQATGGLSGREQGLARLMIEHSDNGAASALWNDAGGGAAVSAFDSRAGMPDTSPDLRGYWGLTWTTPLDQLELLRCVTTSNVLLDGASRDYEYGLMSSVAADQRWGVSAGIGAAHVALKNGWLPFPSAGWQVNSIGAVAGAGRSYLIAVMCAGAPTEGYGIATIEHVSAATFAALRPPPRHRHRRGHSHRSSPAHR